VSSSIFVRPLGSTTRSFAARWCAKSADHRSRWRFRSTVATAWRLAEGVLVLAALDRETLRPARLPSALSRALRGG